MRPTRRTVMLGLGALATGSVASRGWGQAGPKTPMWRATRGKEVVWLFGEYHSAPADPPWRTAAFDRVFSTAPVIFVETFSTRSLGRAWEAVNIMSLPRREQPRQVLPPAEKAAFERLAKRYDLDKLAFWKLKARFAARHILGRHQAATLGVKGINAPTAAMLGLVRQTPERLRELEDIMEPTRIEASADADAQLAFLIDVLNNLPTYDANTLAGHKAWTEGDVEALRDLVDVDAAWRRRMGIEDRMMGERQARWMTKIEAAAATRETAVLVGLSHLVAHNGILPDFLARGFTVERV